MRSKNALYNVVTNLILQVTIILYGFIVPYIIIKIFGSNVNGIIASITQFLMYISLLESGMGPVIKASLFKPINNKNNTEINNILYFSQKFFRKIAYIFILYLLLVSLFYPLVVSEFDYLYTFFLVIIISISTFAEYYFGITYKIFLQADQKNYIVSLIQIVTYVFSILIILILSKFNISVHLLKLISGLIFISRPFIQYLYVKKHYNINISKSGDYILKQKWDGLAQHIASVIHFNTDITILTFFVNTVEVSVYYVYYLVVKGIKSIIQAFSDSLDSTFGSMIANEEYENLNKKFNIYEIGYFTICTIMYSCAIICITPFVKVYTLGIADANYIRPLFGFLLLLGEMFWAIRQPYHNLVKACGHFRQTQIGAWVEALSNLIISLLLVNKFGIIGVAIGTLFAMIIRTLELIFYCSKNILKRNLWVCFKKIFYVILSCIMINLFSNLFLFIEINSIFSFFIFAILIFIIASFITLSINFIVFREEIMDLIKFFKKLILKKNK